MRFPSVTNDTESCVIQFAVKTALALYISSHLGFRYNVFTRQPIL